MRFSKIKHFVADIIEPKKKANVLSLIYNVLMSLVVIASCVFVFVDLFTEDGSKWNQIAWRVELISINVFIVEYILKLLVSEALYEGEGWFKSKISYITSFDSFIDIICIVSVFLNQIPKELAALRVLKLIKLSRLVKLKDAVDEIREDGEEKVKDEKQTFRYRIYKIVYKDDSGDKLSKIYDVFSVVIILLSVAMIILDTFTFTDAWSNAIFIAEVVFAVFFAIEYVLRVWTADFEYPDLDKGHAKMRYIFSFLAIVDLLAILPVFFTFSREAEVSLPNAVAVLKIFKLLRIARLLKMSRYLNSISLFMDAIREKKKQILFSIGILIFIAIICSVLLYSFEKAAGNEDFKNGFSGIYYALTSLAGFDDNVSEVSSTLGRIMVIIMIICGGCIVGVPLGIISSEFETMVKQATLSEEEEEQDLFLEFAKELTPEEKLEIIAKYHKEKQED